jgi:phosphoribosylaminoimidazole-succinocarboxamide synthase
MRSQLCDRQENPQHRNPSSMAEVQTSTNSGELAQRFIEFVMMQAQNAALFLGQIPNPQSGKGEVNLEVAKMFIDQLAMIQEKTRGNLSNEESTVLRNALSNLQLAYVEVARGSSAAVPSEKKAPESAPPDEPVTPEPSVAGGEGESRKKFTKSYGT